MKTYRWIVQAIIYAYKAGQTDQYKRDQEAIDRMRAMRNRIDELEAALAKAKASGCKQYD